MSTHQLPPGENSSLSNGSASDDATIHTDEGGPIAIVGMACRFPGAGNYEQFWQNLCGGLSGISEVPENRWDKEAFYSADPREKNKSVSKWGGFVDGVEFFDADFFGISAREAQVMDPQQRIMLEQAWACIEDAGYDPKVFSGSNTGVYIGVFNFDYEDRLGDALDAIEGHVSTGTHTALIPNRISYFLNLHGPSLPIDTACSSSLVALHKAAHAIRRGECDQALVGGISVLCSPTHFISFSKTGMLSPDGSCKSFDERANGYVRGEGAAMVLVKPLDKAVRDNDRIVAVLRGSAMNHGGHARTVTYPGSLAQSNVVAEALRQASVPVSTVNYVEAHGTGTPKGDPIEVEGLKMAFSRVAAEQGETLEEHSCGIGSVKTNIGHLESVAGLAGVIKTVLCMRHQSFPPLVHYQKLNPRIAFDGSPFFIVDKAQPWPALRDDAGLVIPRRAGISSFGFGGVNSHVIVEEYREPELVEKRETASGPALILLSAKTVPVLRESARQLLGAIASPEALRHDLSDLAYTLQVGRRPMEARLALVADSFEAVQTQMSAWLAGDAVDVLTGQVGAEVLTRIAEEPPSDDQLAKLLSERNLTELAKRWAAGYELDWAGLYGTKKPRRIALPTYPFVKEKHWVEAGAAKQTSTALHPLLHWNSSNVAGLRFSSRFDGNEFFLADHVVQGKRTLPGAAQLEMARCAMERAMAWPAGSYRLKDIVWMHPVAADTGPVDVDLALFPETDGKVDFEIYSEGDGEEPVVYTQGTVTKVVSEQPAPHDLEGLRKSCADVHLSAEQCYAAFDKTGLSYGPGHRGLIELFVGDEQALARIALPEALRASEGSYVLHPSLLDAALQAAIGMREGERGAGEKSLLLPFALGELEILAPCTPQMWAVVYRRTGGAMQKFDIDLCDEKGAVCVRLKEFCVRAAATEAVEVSLRTALLSPEWREASAVGAETFSRRVVFLCGVADVPQPQMPGVEFHVVNAEDDLAHAFEATTCLLLEKIQALYDSPGRHLIQIVVPDEGVGMAWSGLGGMLRCAHLENPNIVGQVIAVERGQDIARVLAEHGAGDSPQVRYVAGKRMALAWSELPQAAHVSSPWKDRGVYLITGGAGGLGLIFAHDIASRAKNPVLILAGRSPATETMLAGVRELERWGAVVRYREVDVGDAASVTHLVQGIHDEFESLDGILHAAGVLRDSFMVRKTAQEVREVLRAKVAGLVNLDLASRDMALDSFICFASTSGALGNVGQADYAAANAFMDGYMTYRADLVRQGARRGRTLSLDWPLWEEGGMQVDAATRRAMTQDTGLVPLRSNSGREALAHAWASGMPQVLVAEGAIDRFKASLAHHAKPAAAPEAAKAAAPENISGDLQEKSVRYFVRLLAGTLKRPAHSIDAHAPMEAYGIDSILVMELTRTLEQVFGSLSKTLLFEYQTLAALAGYFIQHHRTRLSELLGETPVDIPVVEPARKEAPPEAITAPLSRRPRFGTQDSRFGSGKPEDALRSGPITAANDTGAIAIIGLSGRYPQAGDIETFWSNLSGGKDSITEIPLERWDWRRYYDADRSKVGTTYSKWGGFLDGVDQFDPLFFNISPREAELMDPQERLFLECVHGAMEDAGYTRESVTRHAGAGQEGSVGVFVGVMYEEYQLYGAQAQARGQNVALLNSAASVANRISYFCNFHGPSLALDTMCSSSLTAIHLACQSLRQGGCAVAIAGGVNVSIHPNKYLMLAQGKFISGKGRCESFGEGGEGYVPGEGVGAVLLKPLAQAIADGDHIYGIIKATAINHGGKTNGYTVPNPNAQAQVIERALRDGGVDARAISYIEAHGTGTSLGDPIEIAGLSKAFGHWTQDKQYCAIGSAKSNIGHCESAAGIAGVTKVLLQLKHRQLAPSLHSSVLNPNIDFAGTPFVVQQTLGPWERPTLEKDGATRTYPRIAGISSFGAGGANAHVVIEEYEAPVRTETASNGPALVVLSARSEEQLQEQVARLSAFLETRKDDATPRLDDLAYTLQVGREAMDERLGIVARTLGELRAKLVAYLDGDTGGEDVYRGQVKRTKEALTALAGDDSVDTLLVAWLAQGKHGKWLDLWVKGLPVVWEKLYGETKPRRISLPTYPFARERYWIDTDAAQGIEVATAGAVLHPLVHRNTSSFSVQRFSSHFSGEEFFLADHAVRGLRVLPGVAQLEMVRRAVREALEDDGTLQLRDIAWLRPVVVTEGLDLHIALVPQEDGGIGFELYSDVEDGDTVRYSQGLVTAIADASVAMAAHDLAVLREQSTASMSAAQCYAQFEQMGLHYGPTFQGLGELFVGSQQVLARITLPAAAQATQDDYVLHPSLLDAALQATLGWMLAADGAHESTLWLPATLGSMEMLAPCAADMWAVVRRSAGDTMDQASQRFDIDLCDETGSVCIRFRRLELRLAKAIAEYGKSLQTLLMIPSWDARPVAHRHAASPVFAQRRVLLLGVNAVDADRVQMQIPDAVQLGSAVGGDLSQRYEAAAVALLEQLQGLSSQPGQHLIQVVVPCDGEGALLAGLSGMLRTAQLENPRLSGQVIQVDAGQDIAQALADNRGSLAAHIRYAGGVRQVAGWAEYAQAAEARAPWKPQGVYLITGGAGGLGLIFAREIARQAKGATLILTGRSALDERIQAHVRELETLGAVVRYHAVDVADKAAVMRLVRSLPEDYESLDGIIHSAGVVRDSFLIRKTPAQMREVFSAKVAGTLNLDEASADMALDCFIVFSSITGAIGNVGQADYAAANAFMDAFANYRSDLADQGLRHGRTLSINWPLWAEGGMQVDDATRQYLLREIGMTPLRTANGCAALTQAWSSGAPQVLVVEGLPHRLKATLSMKDAPAEPVAVAVETNSVGSVAEDLHEKTVRHLVRTLSSTLKLPAQKIDASAPLETYGIDSVMVMDLTAKLEKVFGSLPKTLFFEYQTIAALSDYFLKQHRAALVELLGEKANVAAPAAVAKPRDSVRVAPILQPRSRFALRHASPAHEAIAIIGLSGRYPQAGDIETFWSNLSGGKDSITEIPLERWDWQRYYDADRSKVGTTYSKWGGFLDGVDQFDPLFFNISPREAELMDPQERLFLECVHGAMEDAGYTRDSVAVGQDGNVGVFVGVMYEEYQLYGAQAQALGQNVSVSNSSASIANRISYFCNFHGPSLALDTMCSSSLTAIHLACQSLRQGGCAVAIAGGVNVSIHPNKYLMLAQGKFISGKGRCESFGEGGEGYVPGEGVGAVLLKPLAQAIADGDHIYGIIKATAINHGGKTNGYTVPNPNAQAQVIERALRDGGVDARAISYIEAHGTGTSLGDPIEIAGLSKAFGHWTQDKQYCAIGSAKSNIGHCESAAGIAGVTKVLLQLKHRQLAPSLHSSVLNPNIDFAGTPFVVQQTLGPWERPVVVTDGVSKTYPRTAGISSFGAGGANAHVVIEEYEAPARAHVASQGPALVVLSARSEERLREQVARLSAFLDRREDDATLRLDDLAYTLQMGREAMDERLGIVVHTLSELRSALAGYLDGETSGEQEIYRGQVKRTKDVLRSLAGDPGMDTLLSGWVAQGQHGKLLDLWVKGLPVAWAMLYGALLPRRISLPTYPFARERYWLDTRSQNVAASAASVLHPLLHRNTSDVAGLRFTTRLSGHEFYLADHRVRGTRVLPGAAQMEMARCAAREALGDDRGLQLRDMAWTRPVTVSADGLDLHIALYPEASGELPFEIYSEGGDGEAVVYSRGRLAVTELPMAATHDLSALRGECSAVHLAAEQCYALFEQMGLHYGPTFQGLAELWVGPGQVLARIALPATAPREGYGLHPSLLDAALQATVGMQVDTATGKADATPVLPFALDVLEMLRPCTPSMWAVVRPNAGSHASDVVRRLDLDLCDEQGAVCVRLRGFSLRPMLGAPVVAKPSSAAPIQTLMFQPAWHSRPAAKGEKPGYASHVVLLGVDTDIAHVLPDAICVRLPTGPDAAKGYMDAAGVLLEQLQTWNRESGTLLLQVVVPDRGVQQTLRGLGGMLRTAQLENPRIAGQIISVEPGQDVVRALLDNRGDDAQQVRYVNGERQVAGWDAHGDGAEAPIPWKAQGVYLITGGAGGLGLIFAREIARQARNPVLILTGRSALSESLQANLRELETLGAVVRYHTVDVTDAAALTALVHSIPEEFESLDGIIHSAGVLRDGYLAGKTQQQLRDVLGAKVAGTLNLDEASRDMPLDCFITFSSIAGALGNIGQADYAVGNAFMDAFAHYRGELVAKGQRRGRTLSVNWPLWDEGGMQVDAATRAMLARQLGMHALETDSGIVALRRAWAGTQHQLLVMAGDAARIRQVLSGRPAAQAPRDEAAPVAQPSSDKLVRELVGVASALIKVKPEDIDDETPLSEYGFDSITFTEFANALNQRYGLELKPTVFFEYPVLAGLAEHLARAYLAIAGAPVSETSVAARVATAAITTPAVESAPVMASQRRAARAWGRPVESGKEVPLRNIQEAPTVVAPPIPGGIPRVSRGAALPLSFAQQRLWFLDQYESRREIYNLAAAARLTGRLDVDALARTLNEIVRRHEALRTTFALAGDEPVQRIAVAPSLALPVMDLSQLPPAQREAEARLRLQEEAVAQFDLSTGPLIRPSLLKLADEEHVLLLAMHHIVSDGWSMGVVVREMAALYAAFVEGQPSPLPELPIQYADFAHWQRAWLRGEVLERQLNYWKRQLADSPSLLALPTDRPRPPQASHAGATVPFAIPAALVTQLQSLGRGTQSTLFMALSAAFNVLLARYSGQSDICIGTPIANRNRADIEGLIGFFVNTLVLRTQVDLQRGFTELLGQVRQHTLEAYAHQDVPFEQLVEALQTERHTSYTPLFQVMLVLQNMPTDEQLLPGLSLSLKESESVTSKFDLTLTLAKGRDGLEGCFEYSTELFDARTIERMAGHFSRLLQAIAAEPERPVGELAMLDEAERHQLLYAFNDTGKVVPGTTPDARRLHELFEAQASLTPHAVAVTYEDESLSYVELNARANRLARHLRSLGVGPDVLVGLCVPRSVEMIVGLLAVLKAGGAYVPLDPAYPADRLSYTLADSAPVAVLVNGWENLPPAVQNMLLASAAPVLDLRSGAQAWANVDSGNLDAASIGLQAHHLAYIIYTSGSTGQPKGVMVAHGNVMRLLSSTDHWYGFGKHDVWTLFHSFAFDFSVWEIWGALAYGGKLVVVPQAVTRSPSEFYDLLCEQGVTVLNQTPSAFRQLIAAQGEQGKAHRLRYVVFGGEALELSALKPWYERPVNAATRLVNMYGITETTVHVTYLALEPSDAYRVGPSPIGRQIPDLQLYVLDAHRQPAPIGVAGELYVGGAGVARGYLNRPELTAERFIAHPFIDSRHVDDPQAKLYKTGDVGRWLADGSVEYLGRNDEQVKIRGFRIELGEIEARVADHPAVREALVLVREDQPGDKRLVAYVVARDGQAMPDETQLRAAVGKHLPEYMVPNHFVVLDSFPLTANGKLDRKALPAPDTTRSEAAYVAPRTPVEEVIAGIWAEVLKLDKVSVHDDFFALGGHSLLAIAMIERMRRVELSVDIRQFFAEPTVAALAVAASKGGSEIAVPANGIPAGCTRITPDMVTLVPLSDEELAAIAERVPGGAANIQDIYPLAPVQEGLLFHHRMAEERDAYLMEMLWAFETRDLRDRFVAALETVIARHDAFRTAMHWEGLAEPVQVVWRQAPLPLEEVSLDQSGDVAAQLSERYNPLNYRLDVRQAPLIRCFVAEDAKQGRWLMQVMLHHLIDDNTSLKLLMGELKAILEGQGGTLPEPLPYRNFVAQARLGVSQAEHEAFFRPMLAHVDEPTAPFGLLDVQGDGTDIAEAQLKLETLLGRRLRQQARKLGVSAASLMHLAWAQVLSRLSGRQDVVFGTVLFGRMQSGEGADRVLGIFINTLPVCIPTGAKPVLDGVRDTHATLTRLLRHEHASLALAQRASGVAAPTPLFSSLLNYRHNAGADASAIDVLEGMRPIKVKERTNYPCLVSIDDSGDGFGIAVQIPGEDRARRVCQYMHTVLGELADALENQPEASMDSLEVMPVAERQLLLDEWNAATVVASSTGTPAIQGLFEAQAARTPDSVAVMHRGTELSYAELNRRANRLAHHLRRLGVGPDVLVGVCMARTPDLLVSLLAVLKAGGAYVPLDPTYPPGRIATMLLDAQPRVLLTQEALPLALPVVDGMTVIRVDAVDALWTGERDDHPSSVTRGDHLAYVIYTSGSTGKPKGVGIQHRNAVAFIHWAQATFDRDSLSKVLASTSVCFDLSIFELFVPLSQGGATWLVDNILDFMEHADALPVTLVNTVPSAMAEVLRGRGLPASVKVVNLAGEALANTLAQALYQQPSVEKVYNLYGPSEDTTYSTFTLVMKGSTTSVSIGRPIAGTQTYILDAQWEPVPLGVAGELFIAGDGLARGYLQRPELTAEKFVPNPFSAVPDARMYRTGDLVRYRADGEIEYLGRIDHQVKVRGFRIELGEIESALQALASEVVVLAREDHAGDKRLVAYLVAHEGQTLPDEANLRALLSQTLPEYMVPSYFIVLERMPLTPNGKVNRGVLPAPDMTRSEAGYVAPRTPAEEIMAGLWAEVLKLDRVGMHDDFFALGGHSLLATQLVSRVQRAWRVELPLRALFDAPTVAALTHRVADADTGDGAPPLQPVGRDTPLALSFAQTRLWFLDQLDRQSALYNIPLTLRLSGDLDIDALGRTLDEILQRHEALRTRFADQEGSPVQIVMPATALLLALSDLSELPSRERQVEAHRLLMEETQTPFDLESDLLIRGALLRLDAQEHILLLTMHHIVSDGWSMGVVVREMAALYQAFTEGRPSPLPELPIQYADFAHWQREWLRGEVLERQLSYWKRQLADSPSLLALPTDRPRPPQASHVGATVPFAIPAALVTQLQSLGRGTQSTLFMTLCAVFNVLLARYSGQSDICIGTPIANRNRADIEDLIGFFVNTLVLRTQVDLTLDFDGLLQQVRQHTLDAYAHQDVPFEQLVEALQPERHTSYTPLFQVMLALQNMPIGELTLPGVSMNLLESNGVTAKFDLMLTLTEGREGLQGCFEYSTELFEARTIERMAGHFTRLLQAIVAEPGRPVGKLTMLDEAERHQLLYAFNDTATAYPDLEPNTQTLHELFEAQASRTPEQVAVVYEGESLTYAELNLRANRLARHLRTLGVGPDVLVGLCVERSVAMIVGLLGVLKAGGAYVPLDPSHPSDRLAAIVDDAKPVVILTQQPVRDAVPAGPDSPLFCLDSDADALAAYSDSNLDHHAQPHNLAYVIYTSGSTGMPKGVMVEHRSILNLWLSLERVAFAECGQAARVGLNASVTFDASVQSLTQLLSGRTLVIFPQSLRTESTALLAYIWQQQLVAFDCTPVQLEMLLDAGLLASSGHEAALKTILVGGEALSLPLWQRLRQASGIDFYNVYGPTECTVDATACALRDAGDWPSIGGPLGNVRVYILDEHGEPVPVGVAGEIYIGGVGVARGYLNRPELTAERFLPDPFLADPHARIYKTGDLGRWRTGGSIEYLGRNDFQVKIRGFRIELGEIEAKLTACTGVRQALVLAREDSVGDKRLVAYLVAYEGQSLPTEAQLRAILSQTLPEYMVPSHVVALERMPLTPNGKVNRGALPAPDMTRSEAGYVAPRTPIEETMAVLWAEVLKLDRVGVHDDFFALGGHSLLAVQLVSQLRKRAGIEMELRHLFSHPTLGALAAFIDSSKVSSRHPNLVPIRTHGRSTPLFLIHPIGGEVQYAFDLTRHLDADQPVYALAASGIAAGETPHASIVGMARVYLEAMRHVQASGPYLVAGWSLGGMIAYEIACQLLAAGEEVGFVGMIDTGSSPHLREELLANEADFDECRALMHWIADLQSPSGDVRQHPAHAELMVCAERGDVDAMIAVSQREGLLPAHLDMALMKRVLAVYRAGATVAVEYEAPSTATTVTYFAADRGEGEDVSFGWGELLGDSLEIMRIGGSHTSIVKAPRIEKLAREIARRLRRRSPSAELSSV
ncbi:non-ribosomal peptide synthetase [Dyella tabacisoli]|uniref:Amino acid adenylation domain-containing protein n=1 Tax=Dyella tabacisoli TaxID=2282381 RepID=A0A369UIQ4_9GAMM|nr:non-ribosomal peptide synthetase [Dyella tabacisoli]RDD80387.1 amino acid adenylation domain-containing protein [Dyella tabacisoli]